VDASQFLLVAGLLLMALLNVATLFWAMYLDRRLRGRPVPKHYDVHVEGTKVFTEPEMAEVQKRADAQLLHAVEIAAQQLQKSVSAGVEQLAAHVNDVADNSLRQEFDKYQASLRALNNQTVEQFAQIQTDLQKQRAELLQQLQTEVAQERDRRLSHFNERINDVVSSYLAETLGGRVDLGAQTAYIFEQLEKHKADIKRDILA
jgi:F0F1-type ATP synthase membrane subunit b/b'